MITFFQALQQSTIFAVSTSHNLENTEINKLRWLFDQAELIDQATLSGPFVGPRKEMVTPWSTNAVEICENMGISVIQRIEQYERVEPDDHSYDRMLQQRFDTLNQDLFTINRKPDPVFYVEDISHYNQKEGLALSDEEVAYLEDISKKLGRKLTDSEVFGFSQVNSEHCRHKIFNGTFIINRKGQPHSLFHMIKSTSKQNPNRIVSAYQDNVAFISGPEIEQFAPIRQDKAEYFVTKPISSVISLKAETHNFPTTVEPFNGAATGSGGEIRDRMAGGKGSIPLAGTAVYMTPYPRIGQSRPWQELNQERDWLYQTPLEILIKASNGASDFGNKFGQPLIAGSVLTFEQISDNQLWGFDKVIMLAGGIGFAKNSDSQKQLPKAGDYVVVIGGDNYRIGMGGSSVSSVDTGALDNTLELNAIQRSNPEMQKRVFNAIRAMTEASENPIIAIHDHGAGGHLNCLSELLEQNGGVIDIDKLPLGDPTLSDKEIIGNESQERMGLVISPEQFHLLEQAAKREKAPIYVVGMVTDDMKLKFTRAGNDTSPIDLDLKFLFGSSPETILEDKSVEHTFNEISYDPSRFHQYLEQVLKLEAVACKDWLTNKVDRSVTGKVAKQQTCGPIQLPLNNMGVMSLDYSGYRGVATAIGHAPIAGLIDPGSGSRLSVTEALTNLIWAPVEGGLSGVSLSANWMWPAKNEGENARLYAAVEAISDFCVDLGINIPTGKDSLSMAQNYPDGKKVLSPGTVIVSAIGEVSDIRKVVEPVLIPDTDSHLIYVNLSKTGFLLGGSSFGQILNQVGTQTPDLDPEYLKIAFNTIQELIREGVILAGHDVSSGGLITCLLEMCFPTNQAGMNINLDVFDENDLFRILFSERPALIIQVNDLETISRKLDQHHIDCKILGTTTSNQELRIQYQQTFKNLDIKSLRDSWFETSFLMDQNQTNGNHAERRFKNYKLQTLKYKFPSSFEGSFKSLLLKSGKTESSGVKAAIIREKGVNGDREMAWALYLAGFDVKDVHMTDLVSGDESLDDINFIVFVGGFSNSDVLGSAKGWAGSFIYNEKANLALKNFYERPDTLSLGVCNGCQLMMELGLIYPDMNPHPRMHHNASGKFESQFLTVDIPDNNSVMFQSLAGSKLGIWVAHGEGRFRLPSPESDYHIVAKYSYDEYPGNPNGSDYQVAALSSPDGRHLAIMPHLERSVYPWNWAYYPDERRHDEVTPWISAFINARKWVAHHTVNKTLG